jgi:hypothetical protein
MLWNEKLHKVHRSSNVNLRKSSRLWWDGHAAWTEETHTKLWLKSLGKHTLKRTRRDEKITLILILGSEVLRMVCTWNWLKIVVHWWGFVLAVLNILVQSWCKIGVRRIRLITLPYWCCVQKVTSYSGLHGFPPNPQLIQRRLEPVCEEQYIGRGICANILHMVAGYSKELNQVSSTNNTAVPRPILSSHIINWKFRYLIIFSEQK